MGLFDFFKGKKNKEKEVKKEETKDSNWESFTGPHIDQAKVNVPDVSEIPTDNVLDLILPKCRHRAHIVSGKKVMMALDGKEFEVPASSQNYLHGYEDDYGIIFSIDMGQHFTYLRNQQVEDLGVSKEQVWKHASDNYLKFVQENMSLGCIDENKDIFTCILDQNQESSIVLYPGIIQGLAQMVKIKKISYACPTVNTFMFWDTDKTEEVKERVIAYCTNIWNQVPGKHRTSLIANSIDLEQGHMKRAFQVVKDENLEAFYLPKKSGISVGQYLVYRGESDQPSFFDKKVILINLVTDTQVYGLIINTDGGKSIQDFNPEMPYADYPVETGGPVSQDQLMFIHSIEELGTTNKIMDGLYFQGDVKRLQEMMANKIVGKGQVRFFNGITVWGKGQLDSEIQIGGWSIHDARIDEFMDADTSSLWHILTAADTLTDEEEKPILWDGMKRTNKDKG